MIGIRLSVCIPTMNRHRFIAETLGSILDQLVGGVEIVIVDGNHDDLTEREITRFIAAGAPIRYIRSAGGDAPSNEGFDRDLDRAVDEAQGEYCWLFADDDVFAPQAIATVLQQLTDGEPELLIVDSEVSDVALKRSFEPQRLSFSGRRDYGPADGDRLMVDAGDALTFVGVVVIRRAVWLARDRRSYYGSGFLHVCVIFQSPVLNSARVLGQPLVRIRMGNAAWSGRAFEIWVSQWPALIWSFPGYSAPAKTAVVAREPWRDWRQVMIYRAYGSFGPSNYRRLTRACPAARGSAALLLISLLPGPVAHLLMTVYFARSPSRNGSLPYDLAQTSRYAGRLSRWVKNRIERIYSD